MKFTKSDTGAGRRGDRPSYTISLDAFSGDSLAGFLKDQANKITNEHNPIKLLYKGLDMMKSLKNGSFELE